MRNYNTESLRKKDELLKCPVEKCNRKYKREDKRQQHVEKEHYFETRNDNTFKFTHDIRAKIYESAASYIVKLYEINNGIDDGKVSAKNLLPQFYNKEISSEDLKRITQAQLSFAEKLLNENLYSCDWICIMNDLERFFNMGLPYYDTNFCPTLTIDFLWHALMQNPDLYINICQKSCIEIMPHCNNDRTENEDTKRYEYFLKIFQFKFKKMPHSFSSRFEAYSSQDIRQIFINLCDRELKAAAIDVINEEEKFKTENELNRLFREKMMQEQELDEMIIKEISKDFLLSIDSQFWGISYERQYYISGYKLDYRKEKLKDYVDHNVKLEMAKPLTC